MDDARPTSSPERPPAAGSDRSPRPAPGEAARAQAAALAAGCVDVLPEGELAQRIEDATRDGRPLRCKLGMDPTSPDVHLGHAVVLGKLREFQDAGHEVVLIIGDYTALVGDPTGRSKSRPVVTPEEVEANAATYTEQAFRVLDPARTQVRRNSEWLAQMSPTEIFALLRMATVAQLLEREDFRDRMAAQAPIALLELLYPVLQGYDSVAIGADIEFGGTDQLFNNLMGRHLMPQHGMHPQLVVTMPILRGTDGHDKMSKSLGNYVGVADEPGEQFGRTMSIPDELMPEWYRHAAGIPHERAEEYVAGIESGATHPNHAKRTLARMVVERFHGAEAAAAAEERFDRTFREREVPDEIPELPSAELPRSDSGAVWMPALLVDHLGVASASEARRLLKGGGVRVDGRQLAAGDLELPVEDLAGAVVQVGKRRFLRVT